MSQTLLPGLRATAVLLVVAPLLELTESALSPLDGSSTRLDLDAIAAHTTRFQVSVTFGLLATFLYLPMFMGLAQACHDRSPRLATTAGWVAAASMGGFLAIRMGQAVELSGVQLGLDHGDLARLVDHAAANPMGALLVVAFLGGSIVGLVLLAVVSWRAGLPRPAAVLLGVFPVVDLLLPIRPFPLNLVSHLVLLVALAWLGAALWRRAADVDVPVAEAVAA